MITTATRSVDVLHRCCQELNGERNRRENLKALLRVARRDHLFGWTTILSEVLSESRRRLNRLWAQRSRLHRVGGKVPVKQMDT